MEKFGIFELLDALSALTEQNAPPAEEPAPSPRQPDGTFDPPVYANDPPPKAGGREADALAGFLARHDAVARKAEKK